MKIAIISKLWETTDPFSTGGTGMSVGTLVNGLVARGHQITLFATGDSQTKAHKLVKVVSQPYKNNYSEIKEYQNIINAFKKATDFDIIHTHVEHKACFFAPLVKTPTLISLRYGELFKDELDLLKQNKKLFYSFNSRALHKKLSFLKSSGIVYNGINLAYYRFNDKPGNYLLYLGRVTPQKGIHLAIQAAKRLNKKLIIAGKLVATDKVYLAKKVLPFIDNHQIVYLGEVKFKEKIRLLNQAQALIQPTQVFEACSNVVLEAQACGTPVIVFDSGSNKEIINNNKTGYLANEKNLIQKIKLIDKINRTICRQWIVQNFSQKQMVIGYEKIYKKLLINK